MHLMKIDPRALKDNPDDARRSKSSPQADALMLATIKAVGIIQPPVGGAFGAKLDVYPNEPICVLLAMKTRRPVILNDAT